MFLILIHSGLLHNSLIEGIPVDLKKYGKIASLIPNNPIIYSSLTIMIISLSWSL